MSSYPATTGTAWARPWQTDAPTTRTGGAWRLSISRRHVQIALGVTWILDGLLQLQPFMYTNKFVTTVLSANADGQPKPLAHSIAWAAALVAQHLVLANTAFALIQILIGVGLLARRTLRGALVASALWGIGVWWVGEGFGQLLTGRASPLTGAPGAVLLYVLIAGLVWPRRTAEQPKVGGDGLLGRLGARVVWALVWALSAGLWLLPANRAPGSIHDALLSAASGEPGWISGTLTHLAGMAGGHGLAIALVLAAASLAIGLGALTRRCPWFLLAGVVLSLAFWVVGQAFGGLLTGQATDPNTGPLFVLLALGALPKIPAIDRPMFSWAPTPDRTPSPQRAGRLPARP